MPAAQPAVAPPVVDYLDRLALALAAAARWWREQLGEHTRGLSPAQLATFEGELCLGLAKLLLRNAQHGLSWRTWQVEYWQQPDAVLLAAVHKAGIVPRCVRLVRYSRMWLESTSDEVLVRVRLGRTDTPAQVWPVAA